MQASNFDVFDQPESPLAPLRQFRLPTVSAVIPTIVVQIFLQIEVDCAAQSPALLQSSFLEMKYDSVFWML